MYLSTSQLFEQLVEGKSISLTLDSKEQFVNIRSHLRTLKSRHNKKFIELFAEKLIPTDVVGGDWNQETKVATFTLTASLKKTVQWKVAETEPKTLMQIDITNLSGKS